MLTIAPRLLLQLGQGEVGQLVVVDQVFAERRQESLGVAVLQVHAVVDPGVVHQAVDPAELRPRLLDGLAAFVGARSAPR